NFSHIHCDSIIKDQINWIRVSGSFIADSTYKYLIIGNFYDDAHTDTFDCPDYALYYVDMICVSTDSLKCSGVSQGITPTQNMNSVYIYPNPANLILQINVIA